MEVSNGQIFDQGSSLERVAALEIELLRTKGKDFQSILESEVEQSQSTITDGGSSDVMASSREVKHSPDPTLNYVLTHDFTGTEDTLSIIKEHIGSVARHSSIVLAVDAFKDSRKAIQAKSEPRVHTTPYKGYRLVQDVPVVSLTALRREDGKVDVIYRDSRSDNTGYVHLLNLKSSFRRYFGALASVVVNGKS